MAASLPEQLISTVCSGLGAANRCTLTERPPVVEADIGGNGCLWPERGQTRPMRSRHSRSSRSLSDGHLIAALQLVLPEAVVRVRLDRANLNRPFAARQPNVSHAEEAASHPSCRLQGTVRASYAIAAKPGDCCHSTVMVGWNYSLLIGGTPRTRNAGPRLQSTVLRQNRAQECA